MSNRWISERKIQNVLENQGWEQIAPRGKKKPLPFIREINGETCEAYGHSKKGDKLIAVACSDRRYLGQVVSIRTIKAPDDFYGGVNRHIIGDELGSQNQWEKSVTDDLVYQLELIEQGR